MTPISYSEAVRWTQPQLMNLILKHQAWAKKEGRVAGVPQFASGQNELNLIGIRNNDERDFNYGKYNDLLIVFNPQKIEVFKSTVDPAKMGNRRGHLRNGAWNAYVIRPHKWDMSFYYEPIKKKRPRWAICQDKEAVQCSRTDAQGNLIQHEWGNWGANIHDPYRQGADTSLMCTVIQNMEPYCKDYVPMLVDSNGKKIPANHRNITYNLNSADRWREWL